MTLSCCLLPFVCPKLTSCIEKGQSTRTHNKKPIKTDVQALVYNDLFRPIFIAGISTGVAKASLCDYSRRRCRLHKGFQGFQKVDSYILRFSSNYEN